MTDDLDRKIQQALSAEDAELFGEGGEMGLFEMMLGSFKGRMRVWMISTMAMTFVFTIIMFLCIELQLNAVNLTFVAFSRYVGIEGQVFVFFVMTVAAAEAAVGLAIIISIFRHYETVNVDSFNLLKW